MNIIADLHTHTLACGHAYSTLTEVIQEASNKDLKAIGLTEHRTLDTLEVLNGHISILTEIYLENLKIPKFYVEQKLILWILSGELDFTIESIKKT